MTVDVVELDSEVVSVAKRFFNLSMNDRMKMNIDDGIDYVKKACSSGKKGIP